MPQAFCLNNNPHQESRVRTSTGQYRLRFRYNGTCNLWSYGVWRPEDTCALCVGRKVVLGKDMFSHIREITDCLFPVIADGATDLSQGDNYELYTRRLKNGDPLITFVLLTQAEKEALRVGPVQSVC